MKLRQLLRALLLTAVTISAQAATIEWDAVSSRSSIAESPWPAGQPIRVCAIRVQFQPDAVSGTSGTGRFGETELFPDTLKIDALPHDSTYFADHLRFIAHYCSTVSTGLTRIESWQLYPPGLDTAYTLDHPMWHYNYNSDQEMLNQRLVELFVESIQLSGSSGIDYSAYDAFIIFHAGIGKDFSIGFDETPFDIPSAYISSRDLEPFRSELPDAVTRGIILPEAQNQKEILEFGIELSLNGIAVKLFGNWLGLPDLFDTDTGNSGIGRWGMMDQGSGNVNALVPARPDAWSRVYMRWENPELMILSGDTAVSRITYSVARAGSESFAPQILKIPVTPSEYYLVENRYTSADSEGCCVELVDREGRRMRVRTDGDIVEIDPGFRVAVSASEYDIGIPGSGVLIWHIDEEVISAGIDENRVNANRERRGVDLVEADGPQDIGYQFGFGSAGSGTALGIPDDAWYAENRDHRNANGTSLVRFNDRSVPSARLYDGSFTYLELTNFSSIQEVMTFRARMTLGVLRGQFQVQLEPGDRLTGYTLADLNGDSLREPLAVVHSAEAVLDTLCIYLDPESPVKLATTRTNFDRATDPLDLDNDGKDEALFVSEFPPFQGSDVGFGFIEDSSGMIVVHQSNPLRNVHLVFAAKTLNGEPRIFSSELGSSQLDPSWITAYNMDLEAIDSLQIFESGITRILNLESFPAAKFAILKEDSVAVIALSQSAIEVQWMIEAVNDPEGAILLNEPDRALLWLEGHGYVSVSSGSLVCPASECASPQVDWDNDGIVDGGGPYGRDDAPREDFPRVTSETIRYLDVDANGRVDLVGFDENRVSVALHETHLPDGFPIAVSGTGKRKTIQFLPDSPLEFVTVYEDSQQFVLSVNRLPIAVRGSVRFPYQEDLSILNVGPKQLQTHDRPDWVYCWPNPTPDITYFRITRSHPAQASVKVFDLVGRLVAELSGSSSVAGAFQIPWSVTSVESGVYIGRVRVRGSGQDENAEIKIAVVK